MYLNGCEFWRHFKRITACSRAYENMARYMAVFIHVIDTAEIHALHRRTSRACVMHDSSPPVTKPLLHYLIRRLENISVE